ncbi:MAG: site-specific integrase [Bdellovibrio sp.]|nr:site-specific integrase [Bdellovibrio sp.]
MTNSKQRFTALKDHKGIRKDNLTGKYVARKCLDKKVYCETFDKLSEAIYWRRNYHPLLTHTELRVGATTKLFNDESKVNISSRPNGVEQRFTFADAWKFYQLQHFPSLESQTIQVRLKEARYFYPDLMPIKMVEINPELLDHFMQKKVAEAKLNNNPRRFNFNADLKALRAFLNWYRENYDGLFVVPILKRHHTIGIIKPKPVGTVKKMTMEQVRLFIDSFEIQFWRDFALLHFFMAGRVQEVAGLQIENIDLERGLLKVVDVAIWERSKKFERLKEIPKNGEERVVHLNTGMFELLARRISDRSNNPCPFFRQSTGERLNFVFHLDGMPLSYRQIQYQYNNALKKAGLFPQFQSTHILRKAMTNIVRKELGLDAAQAAGGWKSRSVVERNYTDAPNELNKQTVDHIGKLIGVTRQLKIV